MMKMGGTRFTVALYFQILVQGGLLDGLHWPLRDHLDGEMRAGPGAFVLA